MREKGKGARANPILKTLLCLFGSGMPLFLVIDSAGLEFQNNCPDQQAYRRGLSHDRCLGVWLPSALGHPRGVC